MTCCYIILYCSIAIVCSNDITLTLFFKSLSIDFYFICIVLFLYLDFSQVYSLTGRDLPKTIRERLKKEKTSITPNKNIKSNAQLRPFVGSIFDADDQPQRGANTKSFRTSTPLNLETSVRQEVKVHIPANESTPSFHSSSQFRNEEYSPIARSSSSEFEISPPVSQPVKTFAAPVSQTEPPKKNVLNIKTVKSGSLSSKPIKTSIKTTSPIKPPKESELKERRRSSTIMARAAFWDSRINQSEVEDAAVLNEFPEMPEDSFKE